MAIVSRRLYDQTVNEIFVSPRPSHFTWEVEIIHGTEIIRPRKLVMLEEVREFDVGYCDKIFASVYMTQAIYEEKVYPNRNDLKMVLKMIPIYEGSEAVDPQRKIQVFTYRATLKDIKDDQLVTLPGMDGQQSLRRVLFQLVELGIDELRLTLTGGIFVNERTIDVIRALLGHYSLRLNLPEQHRIKGVEHREPNVVEPMKNIIIPHGVPLLDAPGYIQKYCGGVYNYGIGYYLHKRVWYVYPLWNTDQYETSRYRMDILVIPPNKMPAADRSWILKGQTIYVTSTGDRDIVDKVDQLMQNKGNGVQFALATNSFNEWAKISGNKATTDPSKSNAQYLVKERQNKQKVLPFSKTRLTDNVAHETSEITKREGRYFQFSWDNSAPRLLYPGMPVKVLYEAPGGIEEQYGVLIKSESTAEPETTSEAERRYRYSTVLTVFIRPRDHAPS